MQITRLKIGSLKSIEEILTFKVIMSLTLIGIFPLLIKSIYMRFKNEQNNRKIY